MKHDATRSGRPIIHSISVGGHSPYPTHTLYSFNYVKNNWDHKQRGKWVLWGGRGKEEGKGGKTKQKMNDEKHHIHEQMTYKTLIARKNKTKH